MQSADIIKSGLDYIDQNLKTDITAEELANMAGYSVWHYSRLFARATGMPVAAYIGKRRLDRALREISGGRRAIDAALEYGFDTYAGFYKAFVRMYGGSPKKYLSKTEASAVFTEKELRDILANWDVPRDLPIMDVYIMDGAKISGNVWSVGEDYILKTGDRVKQLIHRDPNPSNILFDGGEVSGFIDFDLSERNVRLWDPCYYATGILSEFRGVDGIYEKWPEIKELAGINRETLRHIAVEEAEIKRIF